MYPVVWRDIQTRRRREFRKLRANPTIAARSSRAATRLAAWTAPRNLSAAQQQDYENQSEFLAQVGGDMTRIQQVMHELAAKPLLNQLQRFLVALVGRSGLPHDHYGPSHAQAQFCGRIGSP